MIRKNGEAKAPSFDHAIGDPIEEDIVVKKTFVSSSSL